ncbi:unnamed protein product [Caenorhabditis bovis]|uniref:Uncharacterized protein n=1 Tax=Caenorhabditis bovis TaxID=2654633 RepID=A0A8S1F6N5_9PELO|nr:unnamed protein product [Caenorhabditis bovis]
MSDRLQARMECDEFWAPIQVRIARIVLTLRNIQIDDYVENLIDSIFINNCVEQINDAKDTCMFENQHDHDAILQLVQVVEERLNALLCRIETQI